MTNAAPARYHFHIVDGLDRPYPQMSASYAAAQREAARLRRTEDIDALAIRRYAYSCEYCEKAQTK